MSTEDTAAYVIVSSDSPNVSSWDSGALGSQINLAVRPPIKLNTDHQNSASLVDAAIWFSSPNVGEASFGLGNTFVFTNTNAANGPVATQTITFVRGLYGVNDLNATLARETLTLGYGTAISPLFSLSADNGAQRIIITVNAPAGGITINWATAVNPIASLLGFSLVDLGPTVATGDYFIGDQRASFSQGVESYVINADFVNGSYIGGTTGTALSNIPLDASPNSQIVVTSPSTLLEVPCSDQPITSIRAWLTDQAGRRILNEEPWSFSFVIRRKKALAK